jgi:hypothetical protein
MTGRRPNVFASGTHRILAAPRRSTLTERRRVRESNDKGPSVCIKAVIINGNALEMLEDWKLLMNAHTDMHARAVCFRQVGQFRGSAGSADGVG